MSDTPDTALRVVEEIVGSDETSFTVRNRVVSQTELKNISQKIYDCVTAHLDFNGKNRGTYIETHKQWLFYPSMHLGIVMRNMLKLRNRTNVLYVHNFAESSKDDFVETLSPQFVGVPVNTNRIFNAAMSDFLGYSDLNFYCVFSTDNDNYVKAVFQLDGIPCVDSAGQYRLGDNIILSGIPEGVTFDAVYFHGIERAEDRQYSIEEIREDFEDYITDDCQFYDYYETTASKTAMEMGTTEFSEENRWSSTPRDNKKVLNYAFNSVTTDSVNDRLNLSNIPLDSPYANHVKRLHRTGEVLLDKILKVF